jgi:hypothetical protein
MTKKKILEIIIEKEERKKGALTLLKTSLTLFHRASNVLLHLLFTIDGHFMKRKGVNS